jgi:hypothetical protein
MKLRLLLSVLFCAFLVSAYSQITTVGLIGDATPGGWDTDTDMTQDGTNPDLWTLGHQLGLHGLSHGRWYPGRAQHPRLCR